VALSMATPNPKIPPTSAQWAARVSAETNPRLSPPPLAGRERNPAQKPDRSGQRCARDRHRAPKPAPGSPPARPGSRLEGGSADEVHCRAFDSRA
jgi:hypothetical protein